MRRWLSIPLEEVGFDKRGFRGGDGGVRAHLEKVGCSFLNGYHEALTDLEPELLADRLAEVSPRYRGFAFEGAAMAMTLFDALTPGRPRRLDDFLSGAGSAHVYMAHVGAGWAIARLPLGMNRILRRLDPLLRWLALDGYGFHQGYFHWRSAAEGRRRRPRRITGYGQRAFDQGLGRSLWFIDGAEVDRIAATIARFPEARRSDLWSGVGLACTYAGGVDETAVQDLVNLAAGFHPELAQGAAFAAEARRRAGCLTEHTELACRFLCGHSAFEAAEVATEGRRNLPVDGELPVYEHWRRKVQSSFGTSGLAPA
ncbi:MAG: DUF1702 family protein [bacterium]|nr:DUF1702 family protein [bacterium]